MDGPRVPTNQDLKCLNRWHEDTPGFINDQQLIDALLVFCTVHGFPRVKQLVTAMHIIWHDPDKIAIYEKTRQKLLVEKDPQPQTDREAYQ